MAAGEGTVIFNFGAAPGTNVVQTTVANTAIITGTRIEIFLQGTDSTAEHNAYEHAIVQLGGFQATPTAINTGVGFTAQAATPLRLTGTITARYVYST
jgi:hypothetical protein